ncbi:hypothetical protein KAH37_09860 [bacterium]|nr:hypothetical protein [bacterium]
MEKNLNFMAITTFAFQSALKNFVSVIGCIFLWLITIWIPYLNVGTTIAIITLPASLSKGKVISPLEIFDKSYRKYMGEFFLVTGLKYVIIAPAYLFMIIPGIVMQLSYIFAAMIIVDKGKGASESLTLSLNATDGYKWIIFLWFLFYSVVIILIPVAILSAIWKPLGLIYILIASVSGLTGFGYIYGQLTADIPGENQEEAPAPVEEIPLTPEA